MRKRFEIFCKLLMSLTTPVILMSGGAAWAQDRAVTAQVQLIKRQTAPKAAKSSESQPDSSNVVLWLTPLDGNASPNASAPVPQLVQRNKSFEPHVLVVQVGASVQFPNKDPYFHNVFSLYDGKRFDLGLYEAGSTKTVHFDRPGVSFLFCNIHPEMSAVVIAVDSPYHALSDRAGQISIAAVPDGRYRMHVWYERSLPGDLKQLDRVVSISAGERTLEPVRVIENPDFTLAHKNKYGQDYVPPASSGYVHP
jgi:plastocyanin